MDPETLVAPGSLATALIPTSVEQRLLTERPPAPNPAEVLASLMDFPGSVALAERGPDYFIFQTVATSAQGTHPEYGAREFGF